MSLFTWHVDPVHGSIAPAADIAHVHVVGPDVVGEVGLPVHEWVTPDVPRIGGQVDPALAIQSEAIVQLVHSAAPLRRVGHHIHLTEAAQFVMKPFYLKFMFEGFTQQC